MPENVITKIALSKTGHVREKKQCKEHERINKSKLYKFESI